MTIRSTSPIFSQAEIDEVSDILAKAEAADQQEEMKTSAQKVNKLAAPTLPKRTSAFTCLGKREKHPALWERSVRHCLPPLPLQLAPFRGDIHDDILAQLGQPRKRLPQTPCLRNSEPLKIDTDFVDSHRAWAKYITDILNRKAKNLPFEPFEVELGTLKRTIVDLEFLSDEGDFANVYLCSDKEGNKWVLKMYKRDNLRELVAIRSAQMLRYATFMQDEMIRPHMVTHWNFEGHLEKVNQFLEIQSKSSRMETFKSYVRSNLEVPFLFCPYIEGGPFPLEFDEKSNHWINLKNLFAHFDKLGLGNDLKRSNVRIEDDKFKMIDLEECDELDPAAVMWKRTVPTFHPDPKVQQWIYPWDPLHYLKNAL